MTLSKDLGPTAQLLKIRASLFLAFRADYTAFYAKKLLTKLKPKVGKTKPLGKFQISDIETKSFVRLNETNLYRLIVTETTNESNEFFQSPAKVAQLVITESDTLNNKLWAEFNIETFQGNYSTVDVDDMNWIEARYKYYFADVYFAEGKITREMYVQTMQLDDLKSALKDIPNIEIEKIKIIEESKLNSSSCSGIYHLSKVQSFL